MKAKLLLLVLSLCLATEVIQVYAQNKSEASIQQWKDSITVISCQSKQEQGRIDSLQHLEAVRALLQQDFVLEGDELILKHGERGFVNSTTNFVALHDGKATIQISPFYSESGLNGVGGVTVEGAASNIKVVKDKKGNVSFSMCVAGNAISAQVSVHLLHGDTRASTTISPNFNSLTTTLKGKLVPFSKTTVYKGNSL